MLTSVKIKNLILIEQAEVPFGPGLNILTGETGAGKSAILAAIRLISGERADASMIRQQADLAVVEAELSTYSKELLEEEGINPPPLLQPLHLRREIHRSGKNRCFVEDQQVSLSFLKKCAGSAIERIDQSSSASLSSLEEQRKMLDAFADLLPEVALFAASWTQEKEKEREKEALLQNQSQRTRDLEWAEKDLATIEEINWKKGEEEALAQEHHLLTHAQELLEKVGSVSAGLVEGNLISSLKRFSTSVEGCSRFDSQLTPLAHTIKGAALELEEVGRWLSSYLDRLEANPQRLERTEKRIAEIESIKRRFGSSYEAVMAQKEKLQNQIDHLSHLDEQIEAIEQELSQMRGENLSISRGISQRRIRAARSFQTQVLSELIGLNLPHAQFRVSLTQGPLQAVGSDRIQFLFSANPGVAPLPLDQCASGGELSRLLLAIKTVLAEKEKSACLLLDEIDSNVGGQTAAILGDKLKKLALNRQVICITHFVQVARCALHHFLVSKEEREGYAFTLVSKLLEADREREYSRMLGQA
jgi:DNA repair protein RecN (Recombination protein N)